MSLSKKQLLQILFVFSFIVLSRVPCIAVYPDGVIKEKVIVIDTNSSPVGDATLYHKAAFDFDTQEHSLTFPQQNTIIAKTDTNGIVFFDRSRRGWGIFSLVADQSFKKLAFLRISSDDSNQVHTITLTAPAKIKATLKIKSAVLNNCSATLFFQMIGKRNAKNLFPVLFVNYPLTCEVNSLPIEIICPSNCPLTLEIDTQNPFWPIKKDVPPLQPGQVLDLGDLTFLSIPQTDLIGKIPPPLNISDRLTGQSITLDQLKGKVVLLDFWASWCDSCIHKFPLLSKLHQKYAKDGLVIIGIHDTSEIKTRLSAGSKHINLSQVPFQIALDSPLPAADTNGKGNGKTIQAYGVSAFPTLILISKDGNIEGYGDANLENRINMLLYGRTKNVAASNTFIGQLFQKAQNQFIIIALVLLAILLTLSCLIIRFAQKRKLTKENYRIEERPPIK